MCTFTAQMFYIIIIISIALVYYLIWRPKKVEVKPFPEPWTEILEENVSYYRHLPDVRKSVFRQRMMKLLSEIKITGIKTQVEELDTVLIAASAVIPVFGFDEWEYAHLEEVLLYPTVFNEGHQFDDQSEDKQILGMVGSGYMNGKMILSRNALRNGFKNHTDKNNTAIHEFVHLLDKEDGDIDGVPQVLINYQYTIPWLDLIRLKMEEINNDKSDIRNYGGTSKTEFFAVASEYFFERPDQFRRKHPELYKMMEKCFRQNPKYSAVKKKK
ncbi:MAG: zinc-dependent peptidase [Bacteroidia bacterium]